MANNTCPKCSRTMPDIGILRGFACACGLSTRLWESERAKVKAAKNASAVVAVKDAAATVSTFPTAGDGQGVAVSSTPAEPSNSQAETVLTRQVMDGLALKIKVTPFPESREKHGLKAQLRDDVESENLPDSEITKEIERLALLPPVEYGRERAGASKQLGIPRDILDTVVKRARRDKADSGASGGKQGKAMLFVDPEPLPETEARELDGASILQEIAETFSAHLTLPEHAGTVLALWTAFTWVHDAFRVSPLLAVTSPERECGKTTLLSLLRSLVRKPFPSANATAASLFRIVDQNAPTVLADEIDKWLRQSDERMGIINSGWERNFATISRVEGDNNEVRTFSTWAPKALAGILTLPEEIAGRSIEIRMRRQTEAEGARLKTLRADGLSPFKPLRRKLFTWTQIILADGTLTRRDPELPEGFANRLADNWRVLFAIAEVAGEEWSERVRNAALAFAAKEREASWGELLLRDVWAMFQDKKTDRLLLRAVQIHLAEMEERPWSECCHGRPITTQYISRKLAGYGIHSRDMRSASEKGNGYFRDQLEETIKRYCVEESKGDAEPSEANVSSL